MRVINNSDKVYQDLLQNILDNGKRKGDRTGTGTISIPHACVEFDMSEGFPLLTTKKMFTKGITHELLWFLKGDTNIKYLVDNGVNIWTPDAFREYKKKRISRDTEIRNGNPAVDYPPLELETLDEFTEKIKTDEDFTKQWGNLGPVYGKQWVNWEGKSKVIGNYKGSVVHDPFGNDINQIQEVVEKLKNNPDDRRMIVSAWNIAEIDQMALPPCHYDFHLYTEEMTLDERIEYYKNSHGGNLMKDMIDKFTYDHKFFDDFRWPKRKISLIWDQRSVDTFLGLPFNIASYGILLHMFAQQANMVPDKLVGHLKNVHIYSNHVEQCEEQISREPMELPRLELDKVDDIFSYCYENVKFIDYKSHPSIKGEISV